MFYKKNKPGVIVVIVLFFLSFITLFLWGGYRVFAYAKFKVECGDYLKAAAKAETVELAEESLKKAVTYMEKNGLTEGYTSVFWKTSNEDVGFWYTNISSRLQELKSLTSGATSTEKAEVLAELKKTLLFNVSCGCNVIIPGGISVYPHNIPLAYEALLAFAYCAFVLFFYKPKHWEE
jgi:hypothetical protein